MPYLPLQAAEPAYTDRGVPYSAAFDDIYHSSAGAVGQARHVFLAGNDLPRRWSGRERFTLLETGFGLGLNFLATWAAWREAGAPCRLHYVALEKFPFRGDGLAELHRLWPELAPLAAELRRQWPWLTPGFHRLHFDGGRLTLTLILGDALDWLPQLEAEVDAFYLDGFAPSRNPELWSERLFRQIARLSAPDASCATYTVAGIVRQGLAQAGFTLEKRPGYAGKRDMLAGRHTRPKPVRNDAAAGRERSAVVLGAGIAGTAVAHRLAERGWPVIVVERNPGPGHGSSGNRAGILLPVLSLDDNLQSRLSRASFGYALRHLQRLPQGFHRESPGVLQIAKSEEEEWRMREIVERLRLPAEFVRFVEREDTAALCGQRTAAGGWWFERGAWVNPPGVCAAQLRRDGIDARFNATVDAIEDVDGRWRLSDVDGGVIAEAGILIVANAYEARRWLPHLPLSRERRQVSDLPAGAGPGLKAIVCGDGYLTPGPDGAACLGASRDETAPGLLPTRLGHQRNLDKLHGLLPDWDGAVEAGTLGGRAAFRPGSPDRLPLLGAIPDVEAERSGRLSQLYQLPRKAGLFGALGYGARGLTWSALCAELLASRLAGDPLPVERGLADAVDPGRFLLRDLRKA